MSINKKERIKNAETIENTRVPAFSEMEHKRENTEKTPKITGWLEERAGRCQER